MLRILKILPGFMEMKEVFIRETFVLENSENISDNEENENNDGKIF